MCKMGDGEEPGSEDSDAVLADAVAAAEHVLRDSSDTEQTRVSGPEREPLILILMVSFGVQCDCWFSGALQFVHPCYDGLEEGVRVYGSVYGSGAVPGLEFGLNWSLAPDFQGFRAGVAMYFVEHTMRRKS